MRRLALGVLLFIFSCSAPRVKKTKEPTECFGFKNQLGHEQILKSLAAEQAQQKADCYYFQEKFGLAHLFYEKFLGDQRFSTKSYERLLLSLWLKKDIFSLKLYLDRLEQKHRDKLATWRMVAFYSLDFYDLKRASYAISKIPSKTQARMKKLYTAKYLLLKGRKSEAQKVWAELSTISFHSMPMEAFTASWVATQLNDRINAERILSSQKQEIAPSMKRILDAQAGVTP